MFKKIQNTHVKIVNLWLVFIIVLLIGNNFAHWSTVKTITWINCSFFFLLFLQTLFIIRKEIAHQALFTNIAVWTFVSSIQILNTFIGPDYALGGSPELAYAVFDFRRMIIPTLATYVILHAVLSVYCREVRAWVHIVASLLITGGIAVWLFRAILFQSNLTDPSALIAGQTLKLLLFPFICLIGYWVYQFRRDPPISDHIKILLGFFFVYLVIELTDLFTMVYKIKLYAVSQVVLFSTLFFLMVIFFNRLNYISSDFGQYYERLLVSGGRAGIAIIRKQSQNLQPLFAIFQKYFVIRPVYGAITFMSAILVMSYIKVPQSALVNFAAIGIAFLLLFVYWWGLSRKRDLQHNVINFN